ncbi:MAG TPA: DUF5710 domain-containing protein [Ramlibacter sp.]|jgi:hypothetical protein|nr:DUF5710 domain-containing protein [Ramlibacter sp.]
MRTYLNCPFAEKDEAKTLGARWDAAKKRWYVQDVKDLSPFERWMSEEGVAKAAVPKANSAAGVRTGPKELAPHCGCAVLPWEACAHTRT